MSDTRPRWPNQTRAFDGAIDALNRGLNRLCITSPTGTGKTQILVDLMHYAHEQSMPWILYTQRKMLYDQLCADCDAEGIDYGRRAAGHKPALLRDGQIAMIQTEKSKVFRQSARELHRARIVLVDEGHQFNSDACQELLQAHNDAGAIVILVTATPLDMVNVDELLIAGTVSEGRACGALVPAITYGCDEPDLKHIKQYQVGEDLSSADNHKAIMRPGVFGRVLEHWRAHNPEQKPTLLFGPDVKGSLYFAEQFYKAGIPAAHIDGKDVWVNGEFHPSDQEIRDQVLAMSATGEIKVICNRFVLREGLNLPWIECGIFATVFGALTSFIQSGGRLLRNCRSTGKDHVTILDHGGNWHRGFGSLNDDRVWTIGQTNHRTVGEAIDRMREKKEPEPITCPQCQRVRRGGRQCPYCGYVAQKQSRMVVQVDGTLRPVDGEIYRPRRVRRIPNDIEIFDKVYRRCYQADMTFRQAEALYARENSWAWPPRDLPLMPKEPGDWWRKVRAVPTESLIRPPAGLDNWRRRVDSRRHG
jgi:superfamily II DNA or RNA helicase